MKIRAIAALLLLSAAPALAAPQPVPGQYTLSAAPRGAFEAGMEKVEGASGDSPFIHAITDGSTERQISDLALWLPGDSLHGKRLRTNTRLKVAQAGAASCSLEAWDDRRVLLTADGGVRAGTGDWQDCSVVMQIPDNASRVRVRFFLKGSGKVWSDGFTLEEVGADVPETHRVNTRMNRSLD